MSFSKIDKYNYLIEESGDKLIIQTQKHLYHAAVFVLHREVRVKENVNLFAVLNNIRDIVKVYKTEFPEVYEIFFQFLPNKQLDFEKWINICEYYLRRQCGADPAFPIKVTRLGQLLILRFLE